MTIRQTVRRRLLIHALIIVAIYVAGDVLVHATTPGSLVFAATMAALCIATLVVIDRAVSIRCPRCAKPLPNILVQSALGWRNQRCPNCGLDVDEPAPHDPPASP